MLHHTQCISLRRSSKACINFLQSQCYLSERERAKGNTTRRKRMPRREFRYSEGILKDVLIPIQHLFILKRCFLFVIYSFAPRGGQRTARSLLNTILSDFAAAPRQSGLVLMHVSTPLNYAWYIKISSYNVSGNKFSHILYKKIEVISVSLVFMFFQNFISHIKKTKIKFNNHALQKYSTC